MRMLLVIAFIIAETTNAHAFPFTGDPRCPTVNTLGPQLAAREAVAPESGPQIYLQMAQEYEKCMQLYANAGNVWQAYWAGTHAMEWANGAANLGASSNAVNPGAAASPAVTPAYQLIHRVYVTLTQLGIDFAQYGPQWSILDATARQKLGIK